MIERINRDFVATTLPYHQLAGRADAGHALAREVLRHWTTPLALVFLTPEGKVVTKLNSLADLNQVHPDTSRRPEAPQIHSPQSHANNARVLLEHLDRHFPSPQRGRPNE